MKSKRKKPAANAAARATFFHLAEMTPAARRDIANWLRRTARFVEKKGAECSPRFTARFFWT